MAFGGSPAFTFTETWNGSNWTNDEVMNTGRHRFAGSGTSTSALASSGQTPSVTEASEEWYGDGLLTLNITTS